jgi:hypothetical protein
LFQERKLIGPARLQDQTLLVLLSLGQESSTCGSLENLANVVVCLGRAFEVFVRANLLADFVTLFTESVSPKILHGSLDFSADQEEGKRAKGNGSTYLSLCDGSLRGLVQLFHSLRIVTKIGFAANKDDGKTWAEVQNLRDPLSMNLVSRCELECFVEHFTFSWTLSRESGESTAKQMRMTCESGYERGRRRS